MFDALVHEIERLDGDGLTFRATRPEPWTATIARLREEAGAAETLPAFGRVFRRLDATYPNLHSYSVLAFDLDATQLEGRVHLPFAFAPRAIDRGAGNPAFVITRAHDGYAARADAPHVGDEVVAINDRAIAEWVRENQIFCEFPLAEQCALELYDSFRVGLLFWERHEPLALTVRRGRESIRLAITRDDLAPREASSQRENCGVTAARYPGFNAAYSGQHACVFESVRHPGVAVLRIDSFAYRGHGEFHRVTEETDALFARYWREHAASVRRLVIDVIGNHGGDMPVGYYRLLFHAPFQEQYAAFHRIAELDTPRVADAMLWGNPSLALWRRALEADGTWQATPVGGFLPPVPQFCVDDTRDCREGRFEPYDHGFRGTVAVMTDPWCVSSCAGFVWELHDVLGRNARMFGLPDSGDTSYSRLTIAVSPDATAPNGVRVGIEAPSFAREPTGTTPPWIAQVVSVTRTVDAHGRVLSGVPQHIDEWISPSAGMDYEAYASAVFARAIR